VIGDRLRSGDVKTIEDVPAGEGRLIQAGVHKLAVYRDDDGAIQVMSAVCTHLGGIVQWNAAEKTWDCPCHGGIFGKTGECLAGPPTRPLAALELAKAVDRISDHRTPAAEPLSVDDPTLAPEPA